MNLTQHTGRLFLSYLAVGGIFGFIAIAVAICISWIKGGAP